MDYANFGAKLRSAKNTAATKTLVSSHFFGSLQSMHALTVVAVCRRAQLRIWSRNWLARGRFALAYAFHWAVTLFFSVRCSKPNAARVDSRCVLMRHPPRSMARRAAMARRRKKAAAKAAKKTKRRKRKL